MASLEDLNSLEKKMAAEDGAGDTANKKFANLPLSEKVSNFLSSLYSFNSSCIYSCNDNIFLCLQNICIFNWRNIISTVFVHHRNMHQRLSGSRKHKLVYEKSLLILKHGEYLFEKIRWEATSFVIEASVSQSLERSWNVDRPYVYKYISNFFADMNWLQSCYMLPFLQLLFFSLIFMKTLTSSYKLLPSVSFFLFASSCA